MSGTLYVVATPIGNLEDVSMRALRIFREVSLIAAEDTRRTGRLLQHYSISTRTTSLHAHNEREKSQRLVQLLTQGTSIALVSDAGTPLVSDPGLALVNAARAAGIRVEAIPGPSAVMALLSVAGFTDREFIFLGFPPRRSIDRLAWMDRVVDGSETAVFFEAPHRIVHLIGELTKIMGADRIIAIGRELTKAHEEVVVCPIGDAIHRLSSLKGEFTVAVSPAPTESKVPVEPSADELRAEVGRQTENGAVSKRAAVKRVAERYGLAVNDVYKLVDRDS
ncbi:MAG TPA: 16S rRNA (cytidine(1402)-2'-O)-methyltransferase [Vicinamibacterales bacterium]|nr:16S rRNA (cytidine(1402)-2'-O)-methyltransferase [Vicinamibacterales bacterium]